MVRTQVQLTDEQGRRLRAVAREDGVSMAEVVRRSIDRALSERPSSRAALYAGAARLVGAFADPEAATNLAADHDRYLEDALE